MRALNGLIRYVLLGAALVMGVALARHGFSEGMHTIIAAEPRPQAEDTSLSRWEGCELDSQLRSVNPARCAMEQRAYPREGALVYHAASQPGMSKADSEDAGGWLLLAGLAIPFSFGIAAVLGYLILRHTAALPD